jgi:hypothetical protein
MRSSIASQSIRPASRALRMMSPSRLYWANRFSYAHELIEQLPQRQQETPRLVFADDGVGSRTTLSVAACGFHVMKSSQAIAVVY